MKSLIRTILVTGVVFWLLGQFYEGLLIKDFQSLATAVAVLTLANLVVRPVVKLVTLPISSLTLGFLSGIGDVVSLYLTIFLVSGVELQPTHLPGFSFNQITIPEIRLPRLATLFITTTLFSWTYRILNWLFTSSKDS